MSSLVVTEPVAQSLRNTGDLTEIRDPAGKLLGLFAPTSATHQSEQHTVYTTRQVFERLLSQTTDPSMRAYLQQKIEVIAERDACAAP